MIDLVWTTFNKPNDATLLQSYSLAYFFLGFTVLKSKDWFKKEKGSEKETHPPGMITTRYLMWLANFIRNLNTILIGPWKKFKRKLVFGKD